MPPRLKYTAAELPFVLASIEAQTRAMNKFDGSTVALQWYRTNVLYDYAVKRWHRQNFSEGTIEEILKITLDGWEPFKDDAERGGYKIALGILLQQRLETKRARVRRDQELAESLIEQVA